MFKESGTVRLTNGEEMAVKCIQPPEVEYSGKLMRFLEHKGQDWGRDIKERLQGNYAEFCVDRYFAGEIDGNIISQLWYGFPRDGTGVGDFGHVYTEPEHRKKGATNELMRFFTDDFQRSEAKAIFCSSGADWIARIYIKHGFQIIKNCSLVLLKPDCARDFKEFEKNYFEPGLRVNIREGGVKEQFDCDKAMGESNGLWELSKRWRRVFISSQVSTFRGIIFKIKDTGGLVTVAQSSKGSIVGYASILNLGSSIEEKSMTFDFTIHPNYLKDAPKLIRETIEIGRKKGMENIRSYVSSSDKEKLRILLGAGFKEEAVLSNYCFLDETYFDLVILMSTSKCLEENHE